MNLIDTSDFMERLQARRREYHDGYFAMYSSEWGGIVTDPALMLIPLDDHLVHRGDGLFEMLSCVDGAIFDVQAHLDRLQNGADQLKLTLPVSMEEITELMLATVRAGGERTCSVRIFVSRGPGSFGVNPYDCPASHLYVTATVAPKDFMELHPTGARVATSRVPVKHSMFATVKSCDYLMNVMMKMEAVDSGVHFVIGQDEDGFLTEGATENIGLVTSDGRLVFPDLGRVLRGTSMVRVSELAQELVGSGVLGGVAFEHVTLSDMETAREIFILGTSPGIVPVVEYDGRLVNGGAFGPVYEQLRPLLDADILTNAELRTPVFGSVGE